MEKTVVTVYRFLNPGFLQDVEAAGGEARLMGESGLLTAVWKYCCRESEVAGTQHPGYYLAYEVEGVPAKLLRKFPGTKKVRSLDENALEAFLREFTSPKTVIKEIC